VNADIDNEDSRKKYIDSVRSLESEEQLFRAMEKTLKRLIGRLCIAALGQSQQLDGELRKLQAVMRREATRDELDQIIPDLTGAIHALDQTAEATPVVAAQSVSAELLRSEIGLPCGLIMGDERVRALLAAFLVELKRDPDLINRVVELDAKLATSMTYEQLPEVLSELTELVELRIRRIEHAKQEVEAILGQMVGKLDEISQFVADQNQNQSQSLASSQSLNIHLMGEMKAMGEVVESASDLQLTRLQVRSRLDSIGRHLQEFRQREADRDSAIRARNEQMAARVAALEAEASTLQGQLRAEQRLSLLDTLTQIPNRLAYEKRIEEELQRWSRFQQPTCVAVWDIDHFKRINDTYGHRAGDRVLRVVAESLAGRIRGTDFLARYGGEEFVMILAGAKLADALQVIEGMRAAVAELGFHFRGAPVSVTMSCGLTALLTGDSSDAAFDRADKALYQAKDRGRNRCVST
jgi:diguanylate cyclase